MASAHRYLRLPVTKTGVYENTQSGELEFWFFFKGRKCKIGGCRMSAPQSVKDFWEKETGQKLTVEILKSAAKGTVRVDVAAVLQSLKIQVQ